MLRHKYAVFGAGCLLAGVVACSNPANPASPNSALSWSGAAAGANGETMKVTAPELVFPIGGVELDDDDPEFEFRHASPKYASAALTFTYDFELYTGGVRVHAQNVRGDNGVTTDFEIPVAIARGVDFTWRVRARLGDLVGAWSSNGAFSTEPLFTCAHLGPNPLAIIACHRNHYPLDRHPESDELADMMRGIARDFNIAGVPEDHPWGVLQKTSGNNCDGISCDIVCSGNGAQQDQHDVLKDENIPVWGSPIFPIRVDVCITQR